MPWRPGPSATSAGATAGCTLPCLPSRWWYCGSIPHHSPSTLLGRGAPSAAPDQGGLALQRDGELAHAAPDLAGVDGGEAELQALTAGARAMAIAAQRRHLDAARRRRPR